MNKDFFVLTLLVLSFVLNNCSPRKIVYESQQKPMVTPQETGMRIEKSPQAQKPEDAIFTVQIGTFRNASYARALVTMLYEKGYEVYTTFSVSKAGVGFFKVCIGKFSNREEAESLSEKIRKTEDLQTFVTLW